MSSSPKNVLVVEDENILRASMVAGLAKLPGAVVHGAATLGEAIRALDVTAPDVVVSDIDLPDGLGLSLIGELVKRQIRAPIVFVTAYRAAYGSLIPPHANVEVLEKPISLETLRKAVANRIGEGEAASSPFVVADYVQLSCMGRHSVTIDVEWAGGEGRVEVVGGELWSAVDPGGEGEGAFRRLVFRRDVKIRCTASEVDAGPRRIHVPWETLLMESARLEDEEKRASKRGPDLLEPEARAPVTQQARAVTQPAGPIAPPDAPDDPFDALYDDAIAAMMAKNYLAAARALGKARALRPDDAKVTANLKRLHDLGFEPEG